MTLAGFVYLSRHGLFDSAVFNRHQPNETVALQGVLDQLHRPLDANRQWQYGKRIGQRIAQRQNRQIAWHLGKACCLGLRLHKVCDHMSSPLLWVSLPLGQETRHNCK